MTFQPSVSGIQMRILQFIESYRAGHGFAPSLREIGDAVVLSSLSSVHHQLVTLESKGYLHRAPGKVRALSVTMPEEAA